MSFEAVAAAIRMEAPSSTQKLILILVSNYASDEDEAWPSQAKIAEQAGVDVTTVGRALQGLEEAGLIKREERRRPNGSRTSDLIRLTFMQPRKMQGSAVDLTRTAPEEPPAQSGGGPRTVQDPEPITEPKEGIVVDMNAKIDFDVLGSKIFYAASPEAQRKSGDDPFKTILELKEAVARGGDPERIVAGTISFMSSAREQRDGGKFAKTPHVALREDRWVYWWDKPCGAPEARTPSLKVVLKQTVEHEGKTWVSPDGIEATMVGTEKLPGIARQLSDVREWRKFGVHGWAVDKLGPYPDQPGTRVWPSVLEHFGIITKEQAA